VQLTAKASRLLAFSIACVSFTSSKVFFALATTDFDVGLQKNWGKIHEIVLGYNGGP
jgi:hypothetical protein